MRKTLKQQIENKCRYFNGINHDFCEKGVKYLNVEDNTKTPCAYPCFKDKKSKTKCEYTNFFSEDEVNKRIDDINNTQKYILNGISPCCKEPLDKSCVIKDGASKGHGPRFCSKCKKIVFIV